MAEGCRPLRQARRPQLVVRTDTTGELTCTGDGCDSKPSLQALLKFEWVAWKVSDVPGVRDEGFPPAPIPAPRGGAVLAAGRAREPGAARLCLARALKRIGGPCRVKGALRRASPALDSA